MDLTEKQKKILTGEICPYCGKKTELINADDLYHKKGYGMLMICRSCKAWVGCHRQGHNKGKAKGRLANSSLRSLKIRAHLEIDRLWKTQEERKNMYKNLSTFLAIPPEYTHIGMLSEKYMHHVFEFCVINKKISGSNIENLKEGDKCYNQHEIIINIELICKRCPNYLHDKDGYVWCNKDLNLQKI